MLPGDRIENVSIERVMSAALRHTDESEAAAERLAVLREEAARGKEAWWKSAGKKKGNSKSRAARKAPDETPVETDPAEVEAEPAEVEAEPAEVEAEPAEGETASEPAEEETASEPAEEGADSSETEMPEDYEQSEQDEPLLEGEKVNIEIAEEPGE
jgi:hypothetical protein